MSFTSLQKLAKNFKVFFIWQTLITGDFANTSLSEENFNELTDITTQMITFGKENKCIPNAFKSQPIVKNLMQFSNEFCLFENRKQTKENRNKQNQNPTSCSLLRSRGTYYNTSIRKHWTSLKWTCHKVYRSVINWESRLSRSLEG